MPVVVAPRGRVDAGALCFQLPQERLACVEAVELDVGRRRSDPKVALRGYCAMGIVLGSVTLEFGPNRIVSRAENPAERSTAAEGLRPAAEFPWQSHAHGHLAPAPFL